jgi:hypothetical protein
MATLAAKQHASGAPPRGGAIEANEGLSARSTRSEAVGQADHQHGADGEGHQNPVGQMALGCVMGAMTMFVTHVHSSSHTAPEGQCEAAAKEF